MVPSIAPFTFSVPNSMETSTWRLYLSALIVLAVCGSARGSQAVKKEPSTGKSHVHVIYRENSSWCFELCFIV